MHSGGSWTGGALPAPDLGRVTPPAALMLGMTTDQYGNSHRPAGTPAGGQFSTKTNSAPAAPLAAPKPKTPEQLAQEALDASYLSTMDNPEGVLAIIADGINRDRAQRTVTEAGEAYRNGGFNNTLAAALYDCLTDRDSDEAHAAAEWVAENEDDALWDLVGPLLDGIEKRASGEQQPSNDPKPWRSLASGMRYRDEPDDGFGPYVHDPRPSV